MVGLVCGFMFAENTLHNLPILNPFSSSTLRSITIDKVNEQFIILVAESKLQFKALRKLKEINHVLNSN